MEKVERVAERVGGVLMAKPVLKAGKCIVQKKRAITINASGTRYTYSLAFDITFKNYKADGTALNKAEIYLLPEEFPFFSYTLKNYELPLPPHHKLRISSDQHVVCFTVKTIEAPENFARRLSAALKIVEQSEVTEKFLNQTENKKKRGARNVGQI
ncbi:hypothetical protein [Planococcus salinus]|uniref:Uncharacterized protein n=1 Tax=Planococcus salinus TaxID=1848460 RepID=A0A3M8P9G1_9BACL|nr:hypothetical protein [Planococcus salinus]RNF39824.1 hypothetical protein EEX84_07605 [Planococcus salinus]